MTYNRKQPTPWAVLVPFAALYIALWMVGRWSEWR